MLGRHYLLPAILVLWQVTSSPVSAGQGSGQDIHQQAQQKALERQLTPQAPDISLSGPPSGRSTLIFPDESPCQMIHHIALEGAEALPH